MNFDDDGRGYYDSPSVMTDRPRGRRRMEVCDRCGSSFMEGFRWSGLGMPLALCRECTQDIEESVASYGEKGAAAERRLLSALRSIGIEGRQRTDSLTRAGRT